MTDKPRERWLVSTRYVRPDGRIVRHLYTADDGLPYPTRARAKTACKRLVTDSRIHHGDEKVDRGLADGSIEVVPVKVVDLPPS
jgi:hypothetical protein